MALAPSISATETVSANLRMIWRGLLAGLGVCRLEPVIALALYRRISGTFQRIERMLVRFRAGLLWRMPPRAVVLRRTLSRKPGVRLPRKFGWAVMAGWQEGACLGLQLQTVLNTPEMTELLAQSSQAQRILRPLCRALAMELPWVIDKARPAATEVGERHPHKRKPSPKPDAFRIPLPRGVLTGARRQGFGKRC